MADPAPFRWARGFVVAVALAPALAPATSHAHDLWVVAGQYRLEPLETTRVFINSGDEFPQSLTLIGEHRVTALELHGPGTRETIGDFRVDGQSLSFEITPRASGTHVIALATRARRVRLKAEDFNGYLEENGLSTIAAMREEAGETGRAALERYTKWAKAVLDVDGANDVEDANDNGSDDAEPAWSKPVGHAIEIVPDSSPNELAPGGRLGLRVLYQDEPLAGAQLSGGKAGGPNREILTTTDADGRASVTISSAGRWYLRTIHMIRDDDDPEVRWQSFWATLTFEVQ